jgi:hypothetical protein
MLTTTGDLPTSILHVAKQTAATFQYNCLKRLVNGISLLQMTNPIIVVPGSNDFVPHPSDAATGQSGGGTYSGFSSFLKSFSCL